MKQVIRTVALSAIFALSFAFAHAGNTSRQNDSLVAPIEGAAKAKNTKVCSCQILSLESKKNYEYNEVLLFAEKTIEGNIKTDYAAAERRIEKEKRHLNAMFYDRVSTKAELNSASDCKTLYLQLKSANNTLRVYDVLDADAVAKK